MSLAISGNSALTESNFDHNVKPKAEKVVPVTLTFSADELGVSKNAKGRFPETVTINEAKVETAFFKHFGFDPSNKSDLANLKARLQTKDSPFNEVVSSGTATAVLVNSKTGKYELLCSVQKHLYLEMQGKAEQIKTQDAQAKNAGNAKNSASEMRSGRDGYDSAQQKRAEIESKLNKANGANATANNQTNAPTKTLDAYKNECLEMIQKANGTNPLEPGVDVRERNTMITGAYANLYLKNPEAFGWIGAAAYASGQVGFAMDQAVAMPDPNEVGTDPTGDFRAASGAIGTVTNDIRKMLGEGNITIFQNIYPASFAYQQGGIAELHKIEESITDPDQLKYFSPVVRAYEAIDEGIQLNKKQAGSGDQKIKEGQARIIDFEQKIVLQPIFDKYPNTVRLITPFAFGDLDADDTKTDWKTFSRFYVPKPEMVSPTDDFGGIKITNLGSSFGDPDVRVKWIKEEVFPIWETKQKERPEEVKREMQTIVERGRTGGGNYK